MSIKCVQEDIEGAGPGHSRRVTARDADLDAWVSATQRLRGGMTVEQVTICCSLRAFPTFAGESSCHFDTRGLHLRQQKSFHDLYTFYTFGVNRVRSTGCRGGRPGYQA